MEMHRFSGTSSSRMKVDVEHATANSVSDEENDSLLARGSSTLAEATTLRKRRRIGHQTYVLILTLTSGIGGFLFGYDTGVISGALPYIRDDLLVDLKDDKSKLLWTQEVIVSAATVGAGVGSALGGWISDKIGRKICLIVADVLFVLGALMMAAAGNAAEIIAGRVLVGLGIGLASVTVPVYIAEAAPQAVRATLVTVNVLLICSGQFASYLFDWVFTYIPRGCQESCAWRWMLGVAAVPAVLQMLGMCLLPESPRWLAGKGRMTKAHSVLQLLRSADTIDEDFRELQAEVASNTRQQLNTGSMLQMLKSPEIRAEASLGIGLQVLQQLAGINTVMYYTPAILELAGFRDKRSALLVSLMPAGVNAAGTLIGMAFIDRSGRRKLLLCSLVGVTVALGLLGGAFFVSNLDSPLVKNGTCAAEGIINCGDCLHAGCGYCISPESPDTEGSCQMMDHIATCQQQGWEVATNGCPSKYTAAIIVAMLLYLAAFSPGLGPVPWAVNAEIYPMHVRGALGGAAATANWITNALVSQTFLTLTHTIGVPATFWLIAAICVAGTGWVFMRLPETQGLSLDEVQQVFVMRVRQRGAASSSRRGDRTYQPVQSETTDHR